MLMGRRLLAIIRAIMAAGPDVLETDAARSRLEKSLTEDGFLKEEIETVFEWFSVPVVRQEMLSRLDPAFLDAGHVPERDPSVSVVGKEAMDFLFGLKDLGLVDPSIEEDILNRLLVLHRGEVSLDDMRRMAATIMFERQFSPGNEDYNVFDEEWRLLFD